MVEMILQINQNLNAVQGRAVGGWVIDLRLGLEKLNAFALFKKTYVSKEYWGPGENKEGPAYNDVCELEQQHNAERVFLPNPGN